MLIKAFAFKQWADERTLTAVAQIIHAREPQRRAG